MKIFFQRFIFIISIISLCACSYEPILGPNKKFNDTDKNEVKSDVKKCRDDADAYLKAYKAKKIAKESGRKAVIGSVIGSIFGIVSGSGLKAIVGAAAVGAGVGAAVGGLGAAGEGHVTPDQIKINYVNNCLASKGYDIIGWQ